MLVAFALVLVLLVLGPITAGWAGRVIGAPALVTLMWWVLRWPILVVALLGIFAAVLYLGPNAEPPRFRLVTPGAIVATNHLAGCIGAFGHLHRAPLQLQQRGDRWPP